MLLRLRHVDTRRGQHLWLAADSMDAGEWRDLRRLVLQKMLSAPGIDMAQTQQRCV